KYVYDKKIDPQVPEKLTCLCSNNAKTSQNYSGAKSEDSSKTELKNIIGPKILVDRRPSKRPISKAPQSEIDSWFLKSKIKIGPLESDQRNKITRLLFTYKDLNSTELSELPPTDLYIHRVRLREGTKPWNRVKQRRWPPGKEFWLRRIINDGLKCGMYERTMEANGELSDWNAQANLIDKSDNPGEWDEPRLTFNYQNVVEDVPGCFVELSSTTHDYMGHPSHRFFHKLDLKHGYWAISIHPDDRKYFAFSIAGIGQLQPTRMPQGSITSMFSFTELIYIVLGTIPVTETFEGWESLLAANTPNSLPKASFYVDDIFSGFEDFDQGYDILESQLLPRLVWAKLKLSFKKLELFVTQTVVLGVLHKAGGILTTKPERCERIRNWPVPKNTTDVRKFLGAVGFTRRYVKNFAEIRKPLSRLTGNVDFTWESKEQISFQILKEKCAEAVEMHGWNYLHPVKMYTDASLYGGGCVITQERKDSKGILT
ncbi:hypothetical protein EPUL_006749, partial [Erysiphe pulchra]